MPISCELQGRGWSEFEAVKRVMKLQLRDTATSKAERDLASCVKVGQFLEQVDSSIRLGLAHTICFQTAKRWVFSEAQDVEHRNNDFLRTSGFLWILKSLVAAFSGRTESGQRRRRYRSNEEVTMGVKRHRWVIIWMKKPFSIRCRIHRFVSIVYFFLFQFECAEGRLIFWVYTWRWMKFQDRRSFVSGSGTDCSFTWSGLREKWFDCFFSFWRSS